LRGPNLNFLEAEFRRKTGQKAAGVVAANARPGNVPKSYKTGQIIEHKQQKIP
jgi:hypothetical protein